MLSFSQEMEKEGHGGFHRRFYGPCLAVAYITSTHLPWPKLSPMATSNYKGGWKNSLCAQKEREMGLVNNKPVFVTRAPLGTKNHRTS